MNIDQTLFLFLNGFTGRYFYLDFFFYFFATVVPYIIVFLFLFFLIRNRKKNGWFVGEVLFTGFFARYALVELVRYFFPRIRPFQVLEDVNLLLPYKETLSFPSGHTAFLFGISTAVYFYNKNVGIALYIFSIMMGVSRVFAGVHWPTDVFAGALVGILAGLVVSEVSRFVRKKI